MEKIGFMMLGMLFFLMGCQKEGTIAPEQAKTWTKEHLWMVRTVEGQPLTRAVAVKDKLWQAGDTIRIKFLPGGSDSPAMEAKVRQYAAEWLQYAGLYFEYVGVADSADVKIGFDLDSRYLSWSVIGTDCRLVAQDECSLNFFELGMYGEEYDRAEILRGFGHVLGLGFEHRSPESPIVFNSRAESYFSQVCHLNDQDIAGLLTLYNTDQTNYMKYDEKSIMVLDLPRTILGTPHAMISSNLELSEKDKDFIAELYPEGYDALVMMKTVNRVFSMNIEHSGDIQVDWGDGCIETNVYSHTYADSIEHTIRLFGDNWAVKKMDLWRSGLTFLYTGNCKSLEELNCSENLLKKLYLRKNLKLLTLMCQVNLLTSIDLTKNVSLTTLMCMQNPIHEIDLSFNTALIDLFLGEIPIEHLDLSHNVNLENLGTFKLMIDTLDISKLVKLKSASHNFCIFQALDFSNNPNIEWITCAENQLRSINLTNNLKLKGILCNNNLLTSLDLSNNPELLTLDCSGNAINNLNVTRNLKITSISLANNPILENNAGLLDFINSLPIRETTSTGNLTIGNGDLAEQIRPLLESKNWTVY